MALLTVSVAVVEVAVAGLHELVNTARYWLPLMATVGLLIVKVVQVSTSGGPFRQHRRCHQHPP